VSFEDPRRVLARHGLAPKKAFSQNFLVARHAIDAIVRAIDPRPGETVIELGPGLGTLTGALLAAGARVIAVEKDRDMIAVLRAELGADERLSIVEGDAAEVDPRALSEGAALAGNLPYAITGAILRNLCERAGSISRAVIMVQREVRDRLVSEPGTREYGALTVFVQARFEVTSVLKVPAGAFHPPPKVDSAVVKLVPRAVPRAEGAAFEAVVRAAFQARRKTLRNALVQAFGPERTDAALAAASIDGKRRGETLSIEELASLGDRIAPAATRDR
jgi:16S rRNA (adenine1518-N6/adenine1519-N6)-dimethyltransferase